MLRSRFALSALCLLAVLFGAEPAKAQRATFFSMGPSTGRPRESVPYDLREDGRVVVGFEYRDGPVRWNRTEGFEVLGPSDVNASGRSFGISADGRAIVGEWYRTPFRWTPQTGLLTLGDVEGRAFDVSADGNVVVGSRGVGADRAFRWTADEGFLDLGTLGDADGISNAYAVSDDGRSIVGRSMTPAGVYRAFRWTEKEGLRNLGALGDGGSVANGISNDGRVVVGRSSGAGRQAFVWTRKDGMLALDSIQGRGGSAMDVSDDGNVIVGQVGSPRGDEACIWTDGEPQSLSDLLQSRYGIDLTGWFILREITACSGDGTKLVGSGHYGLWRIGFVATIPPPPKMSTNVEPAGIHRAVVGETFAFPFSAQDPGGEPLTFGAAGLPSTASVTPGPGPAGDAFKGIFQWTPTEADLGTTHEVHLYVRDVEQRRASIRFKLRAVADNSSGAVDVEPLPVAAKRRKERPFAAPTRVATSTAEEIAYGVYASGDGSPMAADAYQAIAAAQTLGKTADALKIPESAESLTAGEVVGYVALRAKQSEAAFVAARRLRRLHEIEADDAALVAGAYAYRAGLYAAMDSAE